MNENITMFWFLSESVHIHQTPFYIKEYTFKNKINTVFVKVFDSNGVWNSKYKCFYVCWYTICLVAGFSRCRASDILFISPKVSVNVKDHSGIPSQLDNIVDSPSESRCFTKCKRMAGCKSATFFESVGVGASPQCLLKDTNRFGVRNRIQG